MLARTSIVTYVKGFASNDTYDRYLFMVERKTDLQF